MHSDPARQSGATPFGADEALKEILQEISVPMPVLQEARRRRGRVLEIAEEHAAARDGAGFHPAASRTERQTDHLRMLTAESR